MMGPSIAILLVATLGSSMIGSHLVAASPVFGNLPLRILFKRQLAPINERWISRASDLRDEGHDNLDGMAVARVPDYRELQMLRDLQFALKNAPRKRSIVASKDEDQSVDEEPSKDEGQDTTMRPRPHHNQRMMDNNREGALRANFKNTRWPPKEKEPEKVPCHIQGHFFCDIGDYFDAQAYGIHDVWREVGRR